MITKPPSREQDTRELIQRLQAKQERRRKMAMVTAAAGGVILLAVIVVLVVLVVRGGGSQAGTSATSQGSSALSTAATSSGAASVSDAGGASSTSGDGDTGGASAGSGAGNTGPGGNSGAVSSSSTSASGLTTTSGSTSTSARATTTTQSSTTTTSRPATTIATGNSGLVVVIDPGHQAKADAGLEPEGPGSSVMKAKVSSGTAGVVTGTPESELVLTVSLKLRDALTARGIKVVMTRTTQNVDLSNIQRAQMANEAHANLFVRIHADGSDDHSTSGIHVLYPASIKGWTDDIAVASKKAAVLAQADLIAATGAKDRGIDARSDLTGFNWSDVPVILPEIGFMTNSTEDRLLATPSYQDKIVQGLTKAILTFLGVG